MVFDGESDPHRVYSLVSVVRVRGPADRLDGTKSPTRWDHDNQVAPARGARVERDNIAHLPRSHPIVTNLEYGVSAVFPCG